jgi:DNA polymerase III subunit epsilon
MSSSGNPGLEALLAQKKRSAANQARLWLEHGAVIVDFETTGIRQAEIIQIGAISIDGEVLMDTFVRPTGRISPGATQIHGINDAMVADAPIFTEIQATLRDILKGYVAAVAYNSDYEMGVLKAECRRHHLTPIRPKRWDCAMITYADYWGVWNATRRSFVWQKLVNACRQQGIPTDGAHSAIGDCRMTLALLRVMAQ